MGEWLGSPVARGAVSGIGFVTTLAGLVEFGAALGRRRSRQLPSAEPTLHSDS